MRATRDASIGLEIGLTRAASSSHCRDSRDALGRVKSSQVSSLWQRPRREIESTRYCAHFCRRSTRAVLCSPVRRECACALRPTHQPVCALRSYRFIALALGYSVRASGGALRMRTGRLPNFASVQSSGERYRSRVVLCRSYDEQQVAAHANLSENAHSPARSLTRSSAQVNARSLQSTQQS